MSHFERENDLIFLRNIGHKYFGFGRRSATEITHVDLTAFSVHHDGDGEALLVVESSDAVDDGLVPLPGAVAHVDSGNVHASNGECLELLEPAC